MCLLYKHISVDTLPHVSCMLNEILEIAAGLTRGDRMRNDDIKNMSYHSLRHGGVQSIFLSQIEEM